MMKRILITLICFNFLLIKAQTITPQVINSAGGHHAVGGTGITITDNIGEPFTETLGPTNNIIVTQGFLQPEVFSVIGPGISVLKNDVSCSDRTDGNISIAITNTTSNFIVNFIWSPSSVCPGNNCSAVDSLGAGIYTVVVIVTNTLTNTTDTVKPAPVTIEDKNGPCKVKIYSGVTPNGDGNNDTWTIDNIEEFPDNFVSIYNRWGLLVYEEKGYNNKDKVWPRKGEEHSLLPSTYFYILNLGNGTVLKGWVEIIN
jgi:gliding motility-associated-like protein